MVAVVEDGAILFGLGLIFLTMLAMIITLARFFAGEEHTANDGSPKHRA